jgi:hypothetical protein
MASTTIADEIRLRTSIQTDAINPLAGPSRMVTGFLPNWLKIDALGQSVALWFLLQQYGLSQNETLMVIAVNGVVHGGLHGIACRQQEPIWAAPLPMPETL